MKTIELKNVSKVYPNGVRAMDNVCLTVTEGSVDLKGESV